MISIRNFLGASGNSECSLGPMIAAARSSKSYGFGALDFELDLTFELWYLDLAIFEFRYSDLVTEPPRLQYLAERFVHFRVGGNLVEEATRHKPHFARAAERDVLTQKRKRTCAI